MIEEELSATRCQKHPFESGDITCRDCESHFCSECVVFPDGRNTKPLCIACALQAAGVHSRSKGGRGARKTRKLFRRERIEQRRESVELQVARAHAPQPEAASSGNVTIDWVN